MKLSGRILAALSLTLVAVFYAKVSRQWLFAAVVSAALLGSIALGARLRLSIPWQRVISLALAAGAIALSVTSVLPLFEDQRALKRPWGAAALAALSIAAFRLYLRAPERGPIATFTLGLIALMTSGETRAGRVYGLVAVVYLGAALLTLRAQDRGRPAPTSLSRREWTLTGAVLAIAVFIGFGMARVLPPLSDWGTSRMIMALGDDAKTGFGERMWLGSMEGMLQSDDVVMRLDGPGADYLRGAVFDHYERGRWSTAKPLKFSPRPTGGAVPEGASAVALTLVSGARDRYFLPLRASNVATLEGVTTTDTFGVLHTLPESGLGAWFDAEGPGALAVADPNDEDLQVPSSIQGALRGLVEEWTAGAATPRAKVEALAERLRSTYRYSLHFESRRRDPVLNFLLDVKKGHCEYFASGLTMLARSAGVPARVIIGYRVAEKNPYGGYYVVREKNAHAWVEAHLPGEGWSTFDATPASELVQNAPHESAWLRGFGDLLGFLWSKVRVAWERVSLLQIVLVLGGVIVLGVLLRWWRRRGLDSRAAKRIFGPSERPPPGVLRLFEALEQRGMKREDAEPLERFAKRLGELDDGKLAEAAELLMRYAAFRYGSVGGGESPSRGRRLRRAESAGPEPRSSQRWVPRPARASEDRRTFPSRLDRSMSETDPAPMDPRQAKRVVFFVFVTVFLDLVGFGIVAPLMPFYVESMGGSALTVGVLFSCFSAAQFVATPLLGKLSDRFGRRPIILFSLAGNAAAMVLFAFATKASLLPLLFISRILAGATAGNLSACQAAIADSTSGADRAQGMGKLGAGIGLGLMLGPVIGGQLSHHFGPWAPPLGAAAMALCDFVGAALLMPETRKKADPKPTVEAVPPPSLVQVLSQRPLLLILSLYFLIFFTMTNLQVALAYLVKDRLSWGGSEVSYLFALVGFFGLVIQGALIGPLTRRFGQFPLLITGSTFLALGMLLIAVSLQAAPILAGVVLIGIALGLTNPMLSTVASELAGADRRGVVLGFAQSAGGLARTVGPLWSGVLFTQITAGAPFVSGAVVAAVAVVICLMLRAEQRAPALEIAKP